MKLELGYGSMIKRATGGFPLTSHSLRAKWNQGGKKLGSYITYISSDLGNEFNSRDFYTWLDQKKIKPFYINKSDYKTSYAQPS